MYIGVRPLEIDSYKQDPTTEIHYYLEKSIKYYIVYEGKLQISTYIWNISETEPGILK